MKKLFFLISILLLMPITGLAISLDEIKNDSNRYEKFTEVGIYVAYVDNNSIRKIRQDHPYYTIGSRILIVNIYDEKIYDVYEIFNYDYDQSWNALIYKAKNKYGNLYNNSAAAKELWDEMNRDTGISKIDTSMEIYQFDGTLIDKSILNSQHKVNFNTTNFVAADYTFYKCYGEYFGIHNQ